MKNKLAMEVHLHSCLLALNKQQERISSAMLHTKRTVPPPAPPPPPVRSYNKERTAYKEEARTKGAGLGSRQEASQQSY